MAGGKGLQDVHIDQYSFGLVEGADHIFDLAQIDGGFPAHGGIHLRQDGRRNVVKIDPPHIRGRRESRHITADPAAHGRDAVLSGKMTVQHRAQQRFIDREVLILLPLRDAADDRLPAGCSQKLRVLFRNPAVSDDQDFPLKIQILPGPGEAPSLDEDLIAVFSKIYL